MKFKCLLGFIAVVFGVVSILPTGAFADEILDTIVQGKADYEGGDNGSAIQNLEYAAQLIRQKRGGDLATYLPKPLAGWEAEDFDNAAYGASMFGGMTSVERGYRKGDSWVKIQVVTDAAYVSSIMAMFSNPALVTMSGKKLETIAGQKGIVEYDAAEKRGTINFVIDNKYLITIDGTEVSKEDLWAYAGAIDFAGISSLK